MTKDKQREQESRIKRVSQKIPKSLFNYTRRKEKKSRIIDMKKFISQKVNTCQNIVGKS